MGKKQPLAYLISATIRYSNRMQYLDTALRNRGYRTRFITSDFDHISKTPFECEVPECIQIPVLHYRKNLSVQRILSHVQFAFRLIRLLESLPEEPALVVAVVPPNLQVKYLAKYKKKHPNVVLWFDLFDLWPETFPSAAGKKLLHLPFSIWAGLRNHHLGAADLFLTECNFYREKLALPPERTETVYLAERTIGAFHDSLVYNDAKIELCYLGSINNIIDLDRIFRLICQLAARKQVILHIIGDGERREELAETARNAGATVYEYGEVYDEAQKQAIMDRCRFGLNMMKDSVCVGLTMKSIDYLNYGLPLLNTIPADTQYLVETKRAGIQLYSEDLAPEAEKIAAMTRAECQQMRRAARAVFEEFFEESVRLDQLDELLVRRLPKLEERIRAGKDDGKNERVENDMHFTSNV